MNFSPYDILNSLVPGALFAVLASATTSPTFTIDDQLVALVVYFGYGTVISRIGSVVVEPVATVAKVIKYSDYSDLVAAEKVDQRISRLVEISNMYRTLFASFLICPAIVFIVPNGWGNQGYVRVSIAGCAALFLLSWAKQCNYIRKRVKANMESRDA